MFKWIKSYMPKRLYYRAALILVLPVILLQLIVSIVFIQRHFEGVTVQMTKTVAAELDLITEVIENNGTVLCDDYDLSYAPGVRKAIDEFTSKYDFKCSIICNDRFAKIEKD